MEKLSANQAAKLLGISIENLKKLEKQGLIHATQNTEGISLYSSEEIARIKSRRGLTLAEEAEQVDTQIQHEIVSSVSSTKKVLITVGAGLAVYILLISVFAVLFIVSPIQTAKFLGFVKTNTNGVLSQANQGTKVLAAKTSTVQERDSPLQAILKPIGKVSLGLVKNINPGSYEQVSEVAIIDPSDVLALDPNGAITLDRPISLSESSLLQIGNNQLVSNLNSQYLQGKQPGADIGDIAIVGEEEQPQVFTGDATITTDGVLTLKDTGTAGTYGDSSTIPVLTTDAKGRISGVTNTTISGLTNANLSGSASITNANLEKSSLSLAGNSGNGSVSLGENIIFMGAGITNIIASGSTLTLTSTEADTLESVFNRGNTISTTTGSIPNTIDQATINIGNIANTAQQNFTTLNLANGGTGYLDIEVIKGFINFQSINQLYDDFTGKSLNTTNRWTANSTGAGSSCSLLAGGVNGLLRMRAGTAANRRCEISTQATLTNGYYQRNNNPIFETKLKIDTATNVRIFAGFTNTAPTAGSDTNASTHHAYIEKLATGTEFQCITAGGGTETVTSTGVTVNANTFYRLRVELRNGTIPQAICTVDDGTTTTRTPVTTNQPATTNPMDVYLKVETSNSTAKNMDVDYIRAWQDDPVEQILSDENTNAYEQVSPPLSNETNEESKQSITQMLRAFFEEVVEFFGSVTFHADVTFLGRPTFNKDTAGHAFIKSGDNEVNVIFEKEYKNNPVVTADVNLTGEIKSNDIPSYAVYDLSTKGFKIKLSQAAAFDLSFSWIALFVNEVNQPTNSSFNTQNPNPATALSPYPENKTQTSPTPEPTQEIVPNPTPSNEELASASAQVVP